MTVARPAPTAATPHRARHLTPASPAVQVGSLALVSLAAALTFSRVFDGGGFVVPVVLAALVPHATGLVGRLRTWSPGRTLALGVGASALTTLWTLLGAATTYGVPTTATVRRLDHVLGGGWAVFRTGVAPVPARPGVVLLVVMVVAVMALAADTIARRPDAVLAPLAPSLVVFVLTGTLGADDLRITTTLAYVAAAIVAVALANAAGLESRRTWFTGHRLGSNATLLRNALTIGGVALLVGLVLTPLVPGSGSAPLLRYRNATGGGRVGSEFHDYVGVSPLVDLRARLLERPNAELFRVSASRPLGWRLVALDQFDGTTWSLSSSARDATTVLRRPPRDQATVRQRFTLTSLADRWLPAAYRPVAINLANVRAIPESATLVSPNPVTGLDYQVESSVEKPPSASEIAHTAEALPPTMQRYLRTPSFFMTPRVRAVVAQTGSGTPWARALALRDYFTSGRFTYDTNVNLGDGPTAIDQFLEIRRGFCQQFAAAYAGIARAEGIPSRVVVGFTAGVYDTRHDEYAVYGRDAHAWVELWFAGLGWRTFDPTPAGTAPGMADVRVTEGRTETSATTVTTAPSATTTPTTAPNGGATSPGSPFRDAPNRVSTASGSGVAGASWHTVAAIGLVGVVLLAVLVWWIRRRTRDRRVRRRRRHEPVAARRVAGAWADTVAVCDRAGLPTSAAFTPREQRRSFEQHGLPPDALPALRELVEIYERSVYAPDATEDDTSDRAWDAADRVREVVTSRPART